jgi:phage shock protein PspC (stress-responsive transcriptional regulator)
MKRFVRKQGYVGGVCAGLGEYTGIDAIFWRIGFFLTGWFFVYILIWCFTKQEY